MAVGWSYPEDGAISSCQNSLNMDTRGSKKETASTQHMEEDDVGGIERSWNGVVSSSMSSMRVNKGGDIRGQ